MIELADPASHDNSYTKSPIQFNGAPLPMQPPIESLQHNKSQDLCQQTEIEHTKNKFTFEGAEPLQLVVYVKPKYFFPFSRALSSHHGVVVFVFCFFIDKCQFLVFVRMLVSNPQPLPLSFSRQPYNSDVVVVIVVQASEDRSQHKNRASAINLLRSLIALKGVSFIVCLLFSFDSLLPCFFCHISIYIMNNEYVH